MKAVLQPHIDAQISEILSPNSARIVFVVFHGLGACRSTDASYTSGALGRYAEEGLHGHLHWERLEAPNAVYEVLFSSRRIFHSCTDWSAVLAEYWFTRGMANLELGVKVVLVVLSPPVMREM